MEHLGNRVCFLHFPKTGGTTVHEAVSADLKEGEVCPIRDIRNDLYDLLGGAAQYRFYSGHYDWEFVRCARARGVYLVTQFREPLARITSWYNFVRAHSVRTHPVAQRDPQFREYIMAAKRMDPSDFFRSQVCQQRVECNNVYAQMLGIRVRRRPCRGVISIAQKWDIRRRLRYFQYIGMIESSRETVNFIRGVLGLTLVEQVRPLKVTKDEMRWHEWMEPVELYSGSDIEKYVAPLIATDLLIYEEALKLY